MNTFKLTIEYGCGSPGCGEKRQMQATEVLQGIDELWGRCVLEGWTIREHEGVDRHFCPDHADFVEEESTMTEKMKAERAQELDLIRQTILLHGMGD